MSDPSLRCCLGPQLFERAWRRCWNEFAEPVQKPERLQYASEVCELRRLTLLNSNQRPLGDARFVGESFLAHVSAHAKLREPFTELGENGRQ